MKIISSVILCATCVAALCVGCQSTTADGAWSKDLEDMLVQRQLQELVRSPFFSKRRTLHVMAIGEIKNDTVLVSKDDIEFMKSEIASELTNSGVVMISTVGEGRTPLPHGEKAIAPTLRMYGKLTQRDSRRKDGGLQREFDLELSIVDLASGIQIWKGKSSAGIVVGGK